MQEVVLVANMATPARFPQTGFRGSRRGANIGRTREIWPTLDGFVSFGLRGGKARVPSLELLSKLTGDDALIARDWTDFNQNTATDEELHEIEQPIAAYFAAHTMQELYDIACETNLMLAPANSPREIYASAQLAARDFFGPVGDVAQFPQTFVTVRAADDEVAPVRPPATPRLFAPGRPQRGVNRSNSRGRRGRASGSWSSAPARPARSRPATSPSTAPRCSGWSRSRGRTSSACTRSVPTTRTGSRARRCTTASTSASATSRST